MNVLGVCAGNGVSLYPFLKSKTFKVVGNIEPRPTFWVRDDTIENAQWNLNFGCIPLEKSIDDLLALNPLFNSDKEVDVIIGHPDCGHSSVFAYSRAKKLGNAKSNKSLTEYIESIRVFQPKVFLFENLPNLLKQISKLEFNNTFSDYNLIYFNESVSKFGNSQLSRVRLVVVGIHKDLPSGFLRSLRELNPVRKLKSTRMILNKLPKNGHVREPHSKVVCMEYEGKKLDLLNVKRLWNSEFCDKKKWPAKGTGKGNMKNLPGVYRNFGDDYPLTVRPQNRQFNPDGDSLTPREMAAIQGVPRTFKFFVKAVNQGYYINKGRVTAAKTMPYEVALWFKRTLQKALANTI